ncbi:MAG: nitrate reductase formation protein NapD [Betaproteobacteria bacterium]|nr:nitrate reductase formation protein NapD [Betaproteobacteria bacterium]PWB57368.1 MAG: nitrate reductase formation protein NapD [Betaproteobacteria bacterium]
MATAARAPLNLSGILVVVPPERIQECAADLSTLPGVEVHHTDPATGRLIVVQEADDVAAEMAGLTAIKARPHVRMAEMVYHYFATEGEEP